MFLDSEVYYLWKALLPTPDNESGDNGTILRPFRSTSLRMCAFLSTLRTYSFG